MRWPGRAGAKARVALRVNPDIDASTHAHISTGQRFNKFGVPIEFAATLLRRLAGKPGLEVVACTSTWGRRSWTSSRSGARRGRWPISRARRATAPAPPAP